MAICRDCGMQQPVLTSATKPEGARFIGMCRSCITREIRGMQDDAIDKVKSVLSSLFK
jgi:hypothetical protein